MGLTFSRWWRRLVVPVAVGVTLGMLAVSLAWALGRGITLINEVLWPLALALLLAYIFDPLVSWLKRRWGWSRLLSTTLIFIIGYASLVVLLVWLIPKVTAQVSGLIAGIPAMIRHGKEWIAHHDELNRWLATQPGATSQPDIVSQGIEYLWANAPSLASLLQRGVGVGFAGLGLIFYILSLLVLMPIYTFVFLWRFDRVKLHLDNWVPQEHRMKVRDIARKMDAAVAAFFRGRLIVCVIVGTLTAAAWSAIGLPFGLSLGVLAGIMNLVPFMAFVVALPIAVLVALLVPAYAGASLLILTVVTFSIIQALDGFVLTPTIQGRAAGLHPLTVLIALLIGSAWMGVLGLLLAIPVAAAIKVLMVEWAGPRLHEVLDTGPPAQPRKDQPTESKNG